MDFKEGEILCFDKPLGWTSNYYAPESEGAIAWNDADLAIDWLIPAEKVILSEKDKHHPTLVECKRVFE